MVLFFAVLCFRTARSQDYDRFQLSLDLNFNAADAAVELFSGSSGNTKTIAALKGCRIATATTGLLAHRPLTEASLDSAFTAVKYNQDLGDDVFRMGDAKNNAGDIRDLLLDVKRKNFGQKVVSTVQQLFPPDARIMMRIPVFFVAFGHQNIDAFVRRVVWRDDEPFFVGEGEGTPTIVVNLAKGVHYGGSTDERFIGVMSVVAHEVFHAAFDAYKDNSPVWQSYFSRYRRPIDQLMELTQNEGIAYYLSLIQRTRGRLVLDWATRARNAMDEYNARAEELMTPGITGQRARDIVQSANTSGYWENYGSIAGMVMAREIDRKLGPQALQQTIARGPAEFFLKYAEVVRMGSDAPPLSSRVLSLAQALQY